MSPKDARRASLRSCTCVVAALVAAGCLDRPVAPATPHVTARFGEVTHQSVVTKIDLLFMIDNSGSMADKQEILAEAIPDLVNRLVDPICVNADGSDAAVTPDAEGHCPLPARRDFEPIRDIHIGIITSSIGGHGAPGVCTGAGAGEGLDGADMAHLIARSDTGTVPTFRNLGFLNWNPSTPGAYSNPETLKTDFRKMVTGVGQEGCGYESSLEAVYRFLVDPAPYATISLKGITATPEGIDDVVLRERADFLRPDSLVAIVAVTDENDYSFVDGGIGWVAAAHANDRRTFKGGTSACKTNPNDRCCMNCNEPDQASCDPHATDPACSDPLNDETDPTNLRATRSKEQYGIDFAWPIERYVEGFTRPTLDRFGSGAKNPLFFDPACASGGRCAPVRPENLVLFAGIVGVPWQDIARDPNDLSKGFQDARELVERGTWSVVLGDPAASPPIAPTDPHMIVSRNPRSGIAGPASGVGADAKNGHEWSVPAGGTGDLQYACTFPLLKPRDCAAGSLNCDCASGTTTNNPLCQDTAGRYGTRQFGAKAYPGLRELELLKGLGEQGIVGSICPKNTSDSMRADFGYRPAIATLLARLRIELRNRCLPRTLDLLQDGSVRCVVLEVFDPPPNETCDCNGTDHRGRATPSSEVLASTPNLAQYGSCTCEIVQLTGADRTSCQQDVAPSSGLNGWCYVDPGQTGDAQQCKLVEACSSTDKRILRYVGEQPRGANLILCQEQAFAGGTGPHPSVCP